MIRAAVVFFAVGLLTLILGIYSVAGFTIEAGRLLLVVFFILGALSAVAGIVSGRKPPAPPPL